MGRSCFRDEGTVHTARSRSCCLCPGLGVQGQVEGRLHPPTTWGRVVAPRTYPGSHLSPVVSGQRLLASLLLCINKRRELVIQSAASFLRPRQKQSPSCTRVGTGLFPPPRTSQVSLLLNSLAKTVGSTGKSSAKGRGSGQVATKPWGTGRGPVPRCPVQQGRRLKV